MEFLAPKPKLQEEGLPQALGTAKECLPRVGNRRGFHPWDLGHLDLESQIPQRLIQIMVRNLSLKSFLLR